MANPGINIIGVKLLNSGTTRPLRIRPLVETSTITLPRFLVLAYWIGSCLKPGSLSCHTRSDNVGRTIVLFWELVLDGSDPIQDL